MNSLAVRVLILAISVAQLVACETQSNQKSQGIPVWEKVCAIVGVCLVGLAAFLYVNRNR